MRVYRIEIRFLNDGVLDQRDVEAETGLAAEKKILAETAPAPIEFLSTSMLPEGEER